MAAGDLRFPRQFRLTDSERFSRLLKTGPRVSDARLTLWALPNDLANTRFGLIVGKRHGNAVQRNRLKRRLREAFRLARSRLPAGLDLACAPNVGAAIDVSCAIESLLALTERLARRAARE